MTAATGQLVPVPTRRALLGAAIACALLAANAAQAGPAPAAPADAQFDMSLLVGGSQQADLSRFERGNVVMPGVYRLALFLAGEYAGVADVRFESPTPEANAVPCMTPELFGVLGLPVEKLDEPARARLQSGCAVLPDLIPDAAATYDQSELRLDVTVPQAWLGYRARGYVSPDQWDAGVTAALFNYNANLYRTRSAGLEQTSGFVGLNAGLNLGAWRLRHDGNLNWRSAVGDLPSARQYQSIATYARRDIAAWRAQLTLGDSFTSGELFDSVGVRGLQLSTDDRMLPESQRGYAPTVRGVAETNARVSIRQNGVLLYETTVTPGPFLIDDLYATGYGGDLAVTVTEADGRVREFEVPYASVPQLLRPGSSRFSVAVGAVRDDASDDEPMLVQATLQRGLTNRVTGYAGALTTEGYVAGLGGVALNTRLGAIALDLTAARTKLPTQQAETGQSLRATYSKILPNSGTSFSLASYRYSTRGYYSLRESLAARDFALGRPVDDGLDEALPGVLTPAEREALQGRDGRLDAYVDALDRQRNRFDINVSQRLGERGGQLYATASARDYWTREGTDTQFQVGYNHHFRAFNYSVSASRLRSYDGQYENQFFVSFSVPLGTSPRAPNLTAGIVRQDDGQQQTQLSVNGTAGEDARFSYGVTGAHGDDVGSYGSVNGSWRGSAGVLSGSYGEGDGYSQASVGVMGTLVAHPHGVIAGQPIGDTIAIVSAPNAKGARVVNAPGVRINRFGQALVPYLTPYQMNSIELDPKGLPLDVQLQSTSVRVAPRAGGVSLLTFETQHGRALLLRVRLADGKPVPFGAEVTDMQGLALGTVGQGGRLLLRGATTEGTVSLSWQENDKPMQCTFTYRTPEPKAGAASNDLPSVDARCTPTVTFAAASL
ncbi:fimbria/pilus outer membrane usher protein [Lysobacter arvi]|uniref:Fimbrial biogenesis outer membrane usher protein n=1 Tax=Lysobacter arvi TaxID=3038776 RepID=A0ABU1CHX1_9GAMM|nr:fimbria/pilus outer membrane usher protein [Lysobacter arvi]MDR0184556.1 fimbrial biogenesis outer membrane usher protein [Lysobacter arvi]